MDKKGGFILNRGTVFFILQLHVRDVTFVCKFNANYMNSFMVATTSTCMNYRSKYMYLLKLFSFYENMGNFES